jgi:hypothetical protein
VGSVRRLDPSVHRVRPACAYCHAQSNAHYDADRDRDPDGHRNTHSDLYADAYPDDDANPITHGHRDALQHA